MSKGKIALHSTHNTISCLRLKALEAVLNGVEEAKDIIKQHEIFLGSIDTMPADVQKLRALHSQILVQSYAKVDNSL
jgi:hypothetical protein